MKNCSGKSKVKIRILGVHAITATMQLNLRNMQKYFLSKIWLKVKNIVLFLLTFITEKKTDILENVKRRLSTKEENSLLKLI